ncbi:unnamed protein product, partial [Ilex paraguariensis]
GLSIDTTCPICNDAHEFIDHIFPKCPIALAVWQQVGITCPKDPHPFTDWMCGHSEQTPSKKMGLLFKVAWAMWFNRNKVRVAEAALNLGQISLYAQNFHGQVLIEMVHRTSTQPHLLGGISTWCAPCEGTLKINFDGAINEERKCPGIGH